ncbi:fimbrial protein [Serratia sp. AKBS12]|uniref:fimbrial protein n=1 Tax=Serratia sp. AKBS12 TaxID=2974597 RepID=UPI002165C301|nr:fimbrial protein [Serratia sp. AKBS12]MCS3408330.1 fimbrial protein [Serratia sp. AKBS12]
MNKKLLALLLGSGAMIISATAHADPGDLDGICYYLNGNNRHLASITGDMPEKETSIAWSTPTTFVARCNCSMDTHNESIVFKFKSKYQQQNPAGPSNSKEYLLLDANKEIYSAFDVNVMGGAGSTEPLIFSDPDFVVDNHQATVKDCYDEGNPQGWGTGNHGMMHLYFGKPITGRYTQTFNEVLSIFAKTKSAANFDYSKLLATVSFAIDLSIPAQCQLEPGIITVDFGKLAAADFAKGKGTGTQSVPLKVTCKNSEDVANAKITFKPTDFKNDLIATNDRNLGIKLEQGNSQLKGDSEILLNHGEATIYATPTQSGEEKPAIADFTATATLNIEMN